MANSRLLVLAFFIALSFSGMDVAQGTARRLLQTTTPSIFPNLPPFPGFPFPPFNGFPSIPNTPSAPGFPSFPFLSVPPALPNTTP
ncbi:hypothetical protein DITRI_Ditri08aG0090900 [Diplodiscus trichospermus]